jgi:hypothetical protein
LELLHKNGTQINKEFVATFLEEHPHYRRLRGDDDNG